MDAYEQEQKRKNRTSENESKSSTRKWPFIRHWMINIGTLIAAVVFGILIHYTLNSDYYSHIHTIGEHSRLIGEIIVAVCIALLLNIISPIVVWFTAFEKFKTVKDRVSWVVRRVGLFHTSLIIVFYTKWLGDDNRGKNDGYCWEEVTGSTISRLLFFEGITNLIVLILRYVIYPVTKAKWMKRKFDKMYFDVEAATLNLIFIHTMAGVGIFFFPLLPFLAIGRLIITFYVQKFILHRFCAYPKYVLHPSEVFVPYVVAFFFSYLCVTVSNNWLIFEERPSSSCGPFSGYSNETYGYAFRDVTTDSVYAYLKYFISPWVLCCSILIIGAIAYTLRAWKLAYVDSMNQLHDLLRLERLDREFLLRAMYAIPGIKPENPDETADFLSADKHRRAREPGLYSAQIELLLEQQADLQKLYEENHPLADTKLESESSEKEKNKTDSGSESKINNRKKEIQRYKNLMLPTKALLLLQKRSQRLSVAGKEYHTAVDKILETKQLQKQNENKSAKTRRKDKIRHAKIGSILDNKPA